MTPIFVFPPIVYCCHKMKLLVAIDTTPNRSVDSKYQILPTVHSDHGAVHIQQRIRILITVVYTHDIFTQQK